MAHQAVVQCTPVVCCLKPIHIGSFQCSGFATMFKWAVEIFKISRYFPNSVWNPRIYDSFTVNYRFPLIADPHVQRILFVKRPSRTDTVSTDSWTSSKCQYQNYIWTSAIETIPKIHLNHSNNLRGQMPKFQANVDTYSHPIHKLTYWRLTDDWVTPRERVHECSIRFIRATYSQNTKIDISIQFEFRLRLPNFKRH